jgi:signal transduction histidine kinase
MLGAILRAGPIVPPYRQRSVTRSKSHRSRSNPSSTRGERARAVAGRDVLGPVFDTLPSLIAVLDARGDIVAVNAAWRRFGTEAGTDDPAVGLRDNYLRVCASARESCVEAGQVEDGLRRILAGDADGFELEYRCETPGQPLWFQLQATRWPGRGPVRVVVSHTDITARAHAEQALREADRRKDEFLVMLAHELRSPLAPLLNAARIVERSEPLSERGREAITMVGRQARQLSRLIDDLLDVSRITRGKIELKRRPVDVVGAVREAIEAVAAEAAARAHRIEADLPAAPLYVDADPTRLAQMLGNLLDNACKYTPDGGRIAVSVRAGPETGDTMADIVVTDSGIGIDPAKLPELFELFHQIDTTLDRASGGLGIGLTVVRRLAELHGGHVGAASDGAGRGSTFTLTLPRAVPADPSPTDDAGPATDPPA